MVIKCSLPISQECLGDYTKHFAECLPLPEYITKRSVYLNNKGKIGAGQKIIVIYHCEKSKFKEALKNISKQLDFVRDLPGFSLSAHIYGPHPSHLALEKGREREII
jgi:hypothetical protein